MERPNILFVLADQMRAGALGCSGIEGVQTPNIDSFAEHGTRFARCIANTPVCSPARASLLTGMYALSHRVVFNDMQLRTDVRSLAHCLGSVGYRCAYIGKWHLDCADRGVFVPPGPRRQGFDDYWAAHNCNHSYFQSYYYLNDDPMPIWIDGYEPFAQTELATQYIQRQARSQDPFLLFLSWGPPHCPYSEVPARFLDLYPEQTIRLKPNTPRTADRAVIAGYYAHVTALDSCFGRIMGCLQESRLESRTLVIFSSDHGDMLFSQNRGWKCKPWIESVGIPFVLRWPGTIPEGRISHGLISLVDVMPTLLSLLDIKMPDQVEGRDLSPLLLGDESASPPSVHITLPLAPFRYSFTEWRGLTTAAHTYARFRDSPWILYDDEKDPFQLHNLADSPRHQELAGRLEQELQRWLTRLDDPFDPSSKVAAELCPGCVNAEVPYYDNPLIQEGKQARRKRL